MPESVSTRSAYKMLTCIYLCRTLLFFAPYADFLIKKEHPSKTTPPVNIKKTIVSIIDIISALMILNQDPCSNFLMQFLLDHVLLFQNG